MKEFQFKVFVKANLYAIAIIFCYEVTVWLICYPFMQPIPVTTPLLIRTKLFDRLAFVFYFMLITSFMLYAGILYLFRKYIWIEKEERGLIGDWIEGMKDRYEKNRGKPYDLGKMIDLFIEEAREHHKKTGVELRLDRDDTGHYQASVVSCADKDYKITKDLFIKGIFHCPRCEYPTPNVYIYPDELEKFKEHLRDSHAFTDQELSEIEFE